MERMWVIMPPQHEKEASRISATSTTDSTELINKWKKYFSGSDVWEAGASLSSNTFNKAWVLSECCTVQTPRLNHSVNISAKPLTHLYTSTYHIYISTVHTVILGSRPHVSAPFSPETEKKCCGSHTRHVHLNWTKQVTYGWFWSMVWSACSSDLDWTEWTHSALWVRLKKSSCFQLKYQDRVK